MQLRVTEHARAGEARALLAAAGIPASRIVHADGPNSRTMLVVDDADAARALEAAGHLLEPGAPEDEGRFADHRDRLLAALVVRAHGQAASVVARAWAGRVLDAALLRIERTLAR